MISFEKRFIFVHTPRTGGTSMEEALMESVRDCDIHDGTRHWPLIAYNSSWAKLQTGARWNSSLKSGDTVPVYVEAKNLIDDYFKFTVVRNPWDRMLSYFLHLNGGFDERLFPKMIRLAGKSGEGFYPFVNRERHNLGEDDIFRVNFQSCHSMAHNKDGANSIDFILRFENLQEDYDALCDKIGIERTELPHHNKSDRGHYRDYYKKREIDIVRKNLRQDIKKYGYEF